LGHFLLTRLLLDNLKNAKGGDPRIVYIGTETHNPSSIAGKVPPRADLGDLTGMEKGLAGEHSMIDDKKFNPTKGK
jgi:protochlorophyllide reductase